MVHILYDNITGQILGIDPDNRFINKPNWISGTNEAYDYIFAHNGYCKIDINSIQEKLEEYNNALANIEDLKNKDLINELPIVIDVENVVMIEDTPQEAIASKIRHMQAMCDMMIVNGISYEVNNEYKQFSFKVEDQINYAMIDSFIDKGIFTEETGVFIKSNENDDYINVSINEFKELYSKLAENKFYHLYHFKELSKYIKTLNTVDKIERVDYEDILPNEYQKNVDTKMITIKDLSKKI